MRRPDRPPGPGRSNRPFPEPQKVAERGSIFRSTIARLSGIKGFALISAVCGRIGTRGSGTEAAEEPGAAASNRASRCERRY
jgi:hypothetical protein